jgi:hypothetical protein
VPQNRIWQQKCRLPPYLHGSISTVGPVGSVEPRPSVPFWVIVILFAVHKLACAFTPGRIMANSQHLRFWSMPRITILVLSYCVCVDTHKSFEMPLCAWHHHMLSAAVRQKGSVLKPGSSIGFACLSVFLHTCNLIRLARIDFDGSVCPKPVINSLIEKLTNRTE